MKLAHRTSIETSNIADALPTHWVWMHAFKLIRGVVAVVTLGFLARYHISTQ